ncbi:MAG: glycosyltransferase family 4 protein [Mycobacterium sp.]
MTIVSAYPFHMVDQARQLYKAGVLHRMVTAVPRSRVGLPGEVVSTRMRRSAIRRLAGRTSPSVDRLLNREVVRDFDRWAASQLGEPSVVNGLSGYATHTLSQASARGATIFCDRGSWHILEQKRVLDEEASRIGAPLEYFDPFMLERELCEYQMANRILVPSESARRSFIRQGIDAERVVKVPYGVDISAFSAPTEGRCPGAIVSVATVGVQKGHHHLLEAFKALKTRNASLTLVGAIMPGWDRRLRLDQSGVRATGRVGRSEVIEEMQRASIFVLASVQEGLALVIGQAMACGLPVIATEATGVRELVSDGVEGLVVPDPPSAQRIAEAMDFLLSDTDRAQAMGAAGRRKVESFGGWDRYGRQLVAAFLEGRLESA